MNELERRAESLQNQLDEIRIRIDDGIDENIDELMADEIYLQEELNEINERLDELAQEEYKKEVQELEDYYYNTRF